MQKHLKHFLLLFSDLQLKAAAVSECYSRSKPLHLGLAPAAEVRQVSQRLAVRWESAVHEEAPGVEAGVPQLCVVLVLEPDRAGGAPLLATLVSQVDDGEGMFGLTHDEDGAVGRMREDRCSQAVKRVTLEGSVWS